MPDVLSLTEPVSVDKSEHSMSKPSAILMFATTLARLTQGRGSGLPGRSEQLAMPDQLRPIHACDRVSIYDTCDGISQPFPPAFKMFALYLIYEVRGELFERHEVR